MHRVLLVEDNPGDARLVKEALADTAPGKFDLEWVDTLDTAVAAIRERPPDVILLDMHLPDSSGLPTLIRCRAAAPATAIVILSGLEDEALSLNAMRQGAQDYLVKGQITGASLSRALRYAIERSQTMRVATSQPIDQEIRRHLDIIAAEQALLMRLLGGVSPPTAGKGIDVGAVAADRYAITARLGEGGAGTAYLAEDRTLQRRVVLKALRAQINTPETVREFMKEARLAASVEHPNVVRIYDFGYVDTRPFIVMEWAEGGSLRDRLAKGPLQAPEAVGILDQLLAGLSCIHGRGILHRDVKPANLLFAGNGVAKLADFGLALSTDADQTRASLGEPPGSAGSPGYMSPEAADGRRLGPSSDIYSVGALTYELLTGKPYLDLRGMTWPEMRRTILQRDPAPLPSTVPVPLAALVKRALHKDPARRFGSSDHMRTELQRVTLELGATE